MANLNNVSSDTQWVPISDLMSVLMMLFLFISVIYMRHLQIGKERIEEIAVTYSKLQRDLYKELQGEFEKDLPIWNAIIDSQTLSFRFKEPDILFNQGEANIKEEFKIVLNNFFPRYITILTKSKFKEDIDEIRIEGHTSSEWRNDVSKDYSYFMNMELSQNRTRSVLSYVMMLPAVNDIKPWLQKKLTANGLAFSQPILVNNVEDKSLSRRVEFRVKTNAESRIVKIIEEAQ
jgi:outer membrane protein OmpA-like peptidoglycan-associated protein